MCVCVCRPLQTRAAQGEGEELTEHEVEFVLCNRLTGACLLVRQCVFSSGGQCVHSAAPLKCEITVSITQLYELNVHRHVPAAADDGDGLGNVNDT